MPPHWILDGWSLTLNNLAVRCGVSIHTLRAYRAGKRTPAPAILKKMAKAMRQHAGQLNRMADQLDRKAGI